MKGLGQLICLIAFYFFPFNIVFFFLFGFMRRTMPDSSVEGVDEWMV